MSWKKILGYAWAAPLTIPALLCAVICKLFGWCDYHSVKKDALVFVLNKDLLKRCSVKSFWKRRRMFVLGQVIILKTDPNIDPTSPTLPHALQHVNQMLTFGLFQPVLKVFMSVMLRFLDNTGHYYDNPFELDARRAAGQYIDMYGLISRAEKR